MESNWRMNIPRLGFTGRPFGLIARLLTPVEGYEYVAKPPGATTAYQLGLPVIFDDVLSWMFTIRPTGGLPFPYGHEVEPD